MSATELWSRFLAVAGVFVVWLVLFCAYWALINPKMRGSLRWDGLPEPETDAEKRWLEIAKKRSA